MTQINWQYQVNNRAGGYIVTNTDWNDVAGDLRAFIDQTTSSASDNTPLPIGIDLANDRVYISDPDSTTPEDANHADTTLSVVGTTTLAGDTQQTGTFTVGVDDTGHDVLLYGATTGKSWLWDESADKMIVTGAATVSEDFAVDTDTLFVDTSADSVGFGTTAPAQLLHAKGAGGVFMQYEATDSAQAYVAFGNSTTGIGISNGLLVGVDTDETAIVWNQEETALRLGTFGSERMRVTSAGEVGVGTATPTSFGGVNLEVYDTGIAGVLVNTGTYTGQFHASASGIIMGARSNHDVFIGTNNTTRITITAAGAVAVAGAFSKGSGSFDIAHPTKGGDWRLRHSFIEGPQADLIYRGTVTLSGGTAAIDLDTASHMTDGTWEALCRDPWAMVASSGNAVEWSLSGKTLTITSDTADAVCNWMVIAERQDDHMKGDDCPLCDDDGHFVTEYEREDDGYIPVEEIIPDEADDEADDEAEEAA